MFGYNYKMQIVNPEKGIVKLSPTKGTLAKAFAPAIVIWSALAIAAYLTREDEPSVVELDPDHKSYKS